MTLCHGAKLLLDLKTDQALQFLVSVRIATSTTWVFQDDDNHLETQAVPVVMLVVPFIFNLDNSPIYVRYMFYFYLHLP